MTAIGTTYSTIVRKWDDLPYKGTMDVQIESEDSGKITARVTTDDYYGLPPTQEDLDFCHHRLWGNPDTTKNYLNGVRSLENTTKRIEGHIRRWQQNGDPFSSLVFRTRTTDTPVAVAVLGHGGAYVDKEGEEHFTIDKNGEFDGAAGVSDYALLVDPQFHRQKVGTQITTAMFFAYAPSLVKKNYLVNLDEPHIMPAPLSVIHMTADKNNVSHAALEGWAHKGPSTKYCGEGRNDFYITMQDIQNLKSGKEVIFYA